MIDVGRRIGAKDMACRMMTRAACVTNYRKRSITYYSSALFQGRSGSEHCASCIGKQPPPLSKLTPSLIGGMAQENVSPKMIASVLILSWSCYAGSSGKKGIIGHLIIVSTVNDFLSCVADEVVSWYQAGYKHLVLVVGALGRLTCRLTITV